MIAHMQGDLLWADAQALVNPVNCEGVMGAGLALQVKLTYPAVYRSYRRACQRGEVAPGKLHVCETGLRRMNPEFIVNFPTKRAWRAASRLEDIEAGLLALAALAGERRLASIAVPALGCGRGGLDWDAVRPRIELALGDLPETRVLLYGPR